MLILLEPRKFQKVPSDIKFCKDCKHYKKSNYDSFCISESYDTVVDPVNGSNFTFKQSCRTCRMSELINGCGPLGLKWEPVVK